MRIEGFRQALQESRLEWLERQPRLTMPEATALAVTPAMNNIFPEVISEELRWESQRRALITWRTKTYNRAMEKLDNKDIK